MFLCNQDQEFKKKYSLLFLILRSTANKKNMRSKKEKRNKECIQRL